MSVNSWNESYVRSQLRRSWIWHNGLELRSQNCCIELRNEEVSNLRVKAQIGKQYW